MGKMDLRKLFDFLKEDRQRGSTQGTRGILIASESDKGRIINSGAFRRLQQKAQVFPLDPNASVRTRLTHSIEVSQVGRHICQKIITGSGQSNSDYEKTAAFVNTIESACLLHDIGNPPFGHLGEAAVREWFSEQEINDYDMEHFDGNPQGFRNMSFLSGEDEFGYNLTNTLLLSTIKYPAPPNTENSKQKLGYFSSENETYASACEKVGWATGRVFPFAKIMECADDIAYSMSDLEDGLEKKIITISELKNQFGSDKFRSGPLSEFVSFKISAINNAVEEASKNFVKNIDSLISGETIKLLPKNSESGEFLEKVSAFARKNVYSHESAERIELCGRSVIKGLLNHFGTLLHLSEEDFICLTNEDYKKIKDLDLDFQARLLRRLPKKYVKKYAVVSKGSEMSRRKHLIVDFISGMTDGYALETFQILEGIRIK